MTTSSSQKDSDNGLILFNIPQDVLLPLGSVTVLVALLGGKAFFETLQAVGQASEEVFRGDRLPVLNPGETESRSS